jgi:CRISPR/Cas system CSM-associated protein Csm4 (group 5 of RAMP superfamily)
MCGSVACFPFPVQRQKFEKENKSIDPKKTKRNDYERFTQISGTNWGRSHTSSAVIKMQKTKKEQKRKCKRKKKKQQQQRSTDFQFAIYHTRKEAAKFAGSNSPKFSSVFVLFVFPVHFCFYSLNFCIWAALQFASLC